MIHRSRATQDAKAAGRILMAARAGWRNVAQCHRLNLAMWGLKLAEGASTMIKVCLAGATGWAGSELARSMAGTPDLSLVAAVSRRHAGRGLGDVLGEPRLSCSVYASVA
jgi:hypothetical protein